MIITKLLSYESRLEKLLGKDRLMERLNEIFHLIDIHHGRKAEQMMIQKDLDNILIELINTPAADLVREVLNECVIGNEVHIQENLSYRFYVRTEIDTEFKSVPDSELHTADHKHEKTISAWIPGHDPSRGLETNQTYELRFKVGDPILSSFVPEEMSKIDLAEIPEEGLQTEWVVTSKSVPMHNYSNEEKVIIEDYKDATGFTIKFQLLIPKKEESNIVRLLITMPVVPGEIQLDVLIYTWMERQSPFDNSIQKIKELYRQFQIRLSALNESSNSDKPKSEIGNLVQNDIIRSPASQLNIPPAHEWLTPPGELNMFVMGDGRVHISGQSGDDVVDIVTEWPGVSALVAGPLENTLNMADRFRAKWDNYLNDLDGQDIIDRSKKFAPEYNWNNLSCYVQEEHEQSWQRAATSPELMNLAYDAYTLYDTFFPLHTDIRRIMDNLIAGQKINITWLPTSGAGYIPHVPWGLLYIGRPDNKPINGNLFWGLRYRISYTSKPVQSSSKALGECGKSYTANFFYWGNESNDPVFAEVNWQQQQLPLLQNKQIFVPAIGSNNAKVELMEKLDKPDISPLAVIYLFCHCSVGEGNTPVLKFGGSTSADDYLNRTEIGSSPFQDRPLIFANACTTSTADPYMANELETAFFRRQCRAYIGTEIKVPIQFASRFAFIFFNFFNRKIDPQPIAAGEAIAQARLWLWTNYKNIGGLFYSYVNQYELFMAEADELKKLRAH